jgi:putative restriction endonuclease
MAGRRWAEDETRRALELYARLSFGQFNRGNPDVIALAKAMNRTPSSIAMKLGNFASLDPAITSTGRKGLDRTSALDRKVWADTYRLAQ